MKLFITLAGIGLILASCAKEKIQPNYASDGTNSSTFIEKTIPQSPIEVHKVTAYIGDIYQHKSRPSVEGIEMRNGFLYVTVAHPDYARLNFEVIGQKELQSGNKARLRQLEIFYTTNRVLQSNNTVKSIIEFDPKVFRDLTSKPMMNVVDLKMSYSKYIFRYFYEI